MPPPAQMRLRITRQLRDSIDGIQLSVFRPGYVYQVGTTIANYLLAIRAAEPVADDHPYLILPPEKHLFYPGPTRSVPQVPRPVRHVLVLPRAVAADRTPRRRAQRIITPGSRNNRRAASRLRARVAVLAKKVERIKRQLERLRRAG
jgi:hypothetical protein